MADWRASISFSDRFTHVSELLQALRTVELQKPLSELQAQAQAFEDDVFKHSASKENYEEGISSKISHLKHAQTLQQSTNLDRDPTDPTQEIYIKLSSSSSEPKQSFAKYNDAIYYKHGSSSTVYVCKDPDSPRTHFESPNHAISDTGLVALKVASPPQPAPHDPQREIRILKSLAGQHDHVIELITTFRHSQHLILVFPFVTFPLDQVLLTPALLDENRKKGILFGLMSGLEFIHNRGVIHRDIKPSNILLPSVSAGPAKIIDFGTVWMKGDPASEPADEKILDVGTTCYRAPELLFGNQSYGPSLDMWAAGCVVAEVIVPAERRGRKNGEERGLFIAGDLGSELQLIQSIFTTLGTPDEHSWPEAKKFPDWGKMAFTEYPARDWKDILPGTTDLEIKFVESLLRYESTWRSTAAEALDNEYFSDLGCRNKDSNLRP